VVPSRSDTSRRSTPSSPVSATPGPVTPAPAPGTGQPRQIGAPTIGATGSVSWQLKIVPDSDCRQFVETRGGFPTVTISVQNSCQ
jgi:hypothetical protein